MKQEIRDDEFLMSFDDAPKYFQKTYPTSHTEAEDILGIAHAERETARGGPDAVQSAYLATENADLHQLLNYYRSRCNDFDNERKEYLDRVATLETSHETLHRLKWEVKMRKEEIEELQKALGAANASIFDHKEKILELQAENDALKIQEMEDRKRIQHLLALTQPVTEEVTFFKDCRPGRMTRFAVNNALASKKGFKEKSSSKPKSGAGIPDIGLQDEDNMHSFSIKSVSGRDNEDILHAKKNLQKPQLQAKQSRVLRTVYLPSEQADTLMRTVQMLKGQLEEQKQLSEERARALMASKGSESGTCFEEKHQQMEETIKELQAEISKAQELIRHTTKDYLVTRHNAQDAERMAHEELTDLRSQIRRLISEKADLKQQAHLETQVIREAIQEEGNLCAEEFRKQALEREQDVYILKEQYKAVQATYTTRIGNLQARLKNLRTRGRNYFTRYKELDKRRSLEVEGFANDILSLKRKLNSIETQIYGKGSGQKEKFLQKNGEVKTMSAQELDHQITMLQKRCTQLKTDVMVDANDDFFDEED